MAGSDSLVKSCLTEIRIDHHVDDDNDRVSVNSYRTIIGPAESNSSSDADSSESSRSCRKFKKRSRLASDDRGGSSKKPISQRSNNNRDSASNNGNKGERQQSRNNRDDNRQQHNRSSWLCKVRAQTPMSLAPHKVAVPTQTSKGTFSIDNRCFVGGIRG